MGNQGYWDAALDDHVAEVCGEAASDYLNQPLRTLAEAQADGSIARLDVWRTKTAPYVRSAADCVHTAASCLWRINECPGHVMAREQLAQAIASLQEAAELRDAPKDRIVALLADCRKGQEAFGWPGVDGLYERARDLEVEMRRLTRAYAEVRS